MGWSRQGEAPGDPTSCCGVRADGAQMGDGTGRDMGSLEDMRGRVGWNQQGSGMGLHGGDPRGLRDDHVIRSWTMTFTENSGGGGEESDVSRREPRVQL